MNCLYSTCRCLQPFPNRDYGRADLCEELAQLNSSFVITIGRRVYPPESNLLREANSPHQVLKARVRAEIVDPQVSFEVPRDIQGFLLVSPF
jgi:hypothetical protein